MLYPENAVIQAPLAGHTDMPMRLASQRHGCKYAFTEMIDAGSLVFGNLKTMKLAYRSPQEKFLGVQLVGSDPETLESVIFTLSILVVPEKPRSASGNSRRIQRSMWPR